MTRHRLPLLLAGEYVGRVMSRDALIELLKHPLIQARTTKSFRKLLKWA
jgi:hypothetical protein